MQALTIETTLGTLVVCRRSSIEIERMTGCDAELDKRERNRENRKGTIKIGDDDEELTGRKLYLVSDDGAAIFLGLGVSVLRKEALHVL